MGNGDELEPAGHLCACHLLSVTSGGVAAAASLLPSILGWALLLPNRDPYRWRFWTTCSHFNREAPVLCLPRTPDRCVLYTFKGPSGEMHCSVFPLASLQSQLFKPRHILKRYLCLSLRI